MFGVGEGLVPGGLEKEGKCIYLRCVYRTDKYGRRLSTARFYWVQSATHRSAIEASHVTCSTRYTRINIALCHWVALSCGHNRPLILFRKESWYPLGILTPAGVHTRGFPEDSENTWRFPYDYICPAPSPCCVTFCLTFCSHVAECLCILRNTCYIWSHVAEANHLFLVVVTVFVIVSFSSFNKTLFVCSISTFFRSLVLGECFHFTSDLCHLVDNNHGFIPSWSLIWGR